MNWCRNSIKVINGLQSLAAETKKGFFFFVLWLKKNGVKGDKENNSSERKKLGNKKVLSVTLHLAFSFLFRWKAGKSQREWQK